MNLSLCALCVGFLIDLLVGDPHSIPHPVAGIGKLITLLEKGARRVFPKTPFWETVAGGIVWLTVVLVSSGIPYVVLYGCGIVSPYLRFAAESVMCWQLLATRSLKSESMKVYTALEKNDTEAARKAVSMIVGRDTARLDRDGITRAAVETVAENTSDGVVAPMLFMALFGAVGGFFYKAINTMDSMLGYVDEPYRNIGRIPARADDLANLIPARLSAILMLLAGLLLRMDFPGGVRIFLRDRYRHASPNSAQTESVCAGLLRIRLAGDAWYHGVLHRKPYIGDDLRPVEPEDIKRACALLYLTAALAMAPVVAAAFLSV